MADVIRVTGLVELRRALREMQDAENLIEVRLALKAAAGIVADDAKRRVPSRSGRAAGSIRPLAGGAKAYVAGGTAGVPYYGWLDFGTRNPRKGNPRTQGPWSGSGKGPSRGRFIYPALDAKSEEVADVVGRGLDQVIRKAGFK